MADDDRYACPLRRCNGHIDIAARGAHADGRTIEMGACTVCGKIVELDVPVTDHPTLFGDDT